MKEDWFSNYNANLNLNCEAASKAINGLLRSTCLMRLPLPNFCSLLSVGPFSRCCSFDLQPFLSFFLGTANRWFHWCWPPPFGASAEPASTQLGQVRRQKRVTQHGSIIKRCAANIGRRCAISEEVAIMIANHDNEINAARIERTGRENKQNLASYILSGASFAQQRRFKSSEATSDVVIKRKRFPPRLVN